MNKLLAKQEKEKTSRLAKNQPAKPTAVKIESLDMPHSGSNNSASYSVMKHQVDARGSATGLKLGGPKRQNY